MRLSASAWSMAWPISASVTICWDMVAPAVRSMR
jgi:hypothetical protein